VKHTASLRFWRCYQSLPRDIQAISEAGVHWFWIGSHDDYDRLVGS
jgi:hypothetical protein